MATIKISQLNDAATLTGSEQLPMVQSGQTVKGTTQNTANLAPDNNVVFNHKVSLSSAQILNLNSVAQTLIAAAGSGKVINVLSIITNLTFVSSAYITNTSLQFSVGNGSLVFGTISGAISGSSNKLSLLTGSSGNSDPATITNSAVKVICPSGNPAAGDGTLDIHLTYTIITL